MSEYDDPNAPPDLLGRDVAAMPPQPSRNDPLPEGFEEFLRRQSQGEQFPDVAAYGREHPKDAIAKTMGSLGQVAGSAGPAMLPRAITIPLLAGLTASTIGSDAATKAKAPPSVAPPMSLPGIPAQTNTEYLSLLKRVQNNDFDNRLDRQNALDRIKEIRALSNTFTAQGSAEQQKEWNDAVERSKAAFDQEMARNRRFSESSFGKKWTEYNPLGPTAAGTIAGLASRALHPESAVLWPLISGGASGALSTNFPLASDAFFTETENPEKRAYEKAAFALPEGHPDKKRFADYAATLPEANPVRENAAKEFYDPKKATERMLFGAGEGAVGGEFGSAAFTTGRAFLNWLRGLGSRGTPPGTPPGVGQAAPGNAEPPGGPGGQGTANTPPEVPEPPTPWGGPPTRDVSSSTPTPKPKRTKIPKEITPRQQADKDLKTARKQWAQEQPKAAPTPPEPEDTGSGFFRAGGRIRKAAGGSVHVGPLTQDNAGGRTDTIPVDVESGAYVVPADIVSWLGQGDTAAGYKVLGHMFGADAGPGKPTPILAAGGEYVISPSAAQKVGRGDLAAGHDALDHWVKVERRKQIMKLSSLPPPKQD